MISIYGLSNCEACLYVKQLCQTYDLEFDFKNVVDRQLFREMRSIFNSTDVPQILWDDVKLTGPSQFRAELMKRTN